KIIPNQDQQFTIQDIDSELRKKDYSVVHIATHGEFDFDPELSFLVTEGAKLKLSRFEEMMRQVNTDRTRIDILALTGCKTAVGDPRSSLGLAGIAVQSGVSSAIASLWQIEETASTPLLMQKFYQNYLDGKSKAKALQIAQIELIHGEASASRRPYYWSPFILIGNWL
ncbi:MAG: CHAT domain-containing protein, partial [Limnothrix sp.]